MSPPDTHLRVGGVYRPPGYGNIYKANFLIGGIPPADFANLLLNILHGRFDAAL